MSDQLVYLVLPDWVSVSANDIGEFWFRDILSYSLSDSVGCSWFSLLGEEIPSSGPDGDVIKEELRDYISRLGLSCSDETVVESDLIEITTKAVIETLNLNRELLISLYDMDFLITDIKHLDSKVKRIYLTVRTW